MATKYHQIVLSDIFQTAKINSLTIHPLFFSFFQNTLTWMNLSHLNFIRLSIILWGGNGIIP